jgi:hypothetical protein
MNSLMGMVADFLDRLSDPTFGRQENETYNLRLGILLDNDERLSEQLANADLSADDVPALSLAAWMWYLRWRALSGAEAPGNAFLASLYDSTTEPIVRLRVVEAVVTHSRGYRDVIDDEQGPRELSWLPDNWLRERIYSIVIGESEPEVGEVGATQEEQAWELSAYLLQLGDDLSITTLAALLAERWSGQRFLVTRIREVLYRPGLDPEIVEQLRRRLGLDGADEDQM